MLKIIANIVFLIFHNPASSGTIKSFSESHLELENKTILPKCHWPGF